MYTAFPVRYNTEKTSHRVITDARRIVDTNAIETRVDQIFIHLTIFFFHRVLYVLCIVDICVKVCIVSLSDQLYCCATRYYNIIKCPI